MVPLKDMRQFNISKVHVIFGEVLSFVDKWYLVIN